MINIRDKLDNAIYEVQDVIDIFKDNPNEYTERYLKILDRVETDLNFIIGHYTLAESAKNDGKTKDSEELS